MIEIVLSGPGRNALGMRTMQACLDALEAAKGAPVLLTGDGPAFSAGLDLKEVSAFTTESAKGFLALLDRLVDALYKYPGPTAALVNGHAIAGGAVLALCCDYRVAVDDSGVRIGLNEVALGLRFPPAILELVRRRVPERHLETVVLGAGLFSPREALRLGLIDAVEEAPRPRAEAVLSVLSNHPRDAYADTKAALRPKLEGRPREVAAFEERGLASWSSPELKARIASILKK